MDSDNNFLQPNKYKNIDLVLNFYECPDLNHAFQLINSKIGYPDFLYTDETKRNSLNDIIQNSTIVKSNDKLNFKLKGVNESGEQETPWIEELIDIMYDLMWDRKDVYISMAYHGEEDNIVEINDNSYEEDSDYDEYDKEDSDALDQLTSSRAENNCNEDDSNCNEDESHSECENNNYSLGRDDSECNEDAKGKSSGDSECEDDNCIEDDDCADDYKCKEFILDFSNCRHKGDAFKLFRKVIGFIGFGYSLDSLVDILRGDYGHFTYKDNVLLRIRGRQNAEINIPDWAKMVEIMSLRKKVKVQFEDDESLSNNKSDDESDDEFSNMPLHTFMFINDFPESDMSALVGTNAFVLQQISQGGLIPVLGTMIELPYTMFCDIPTSKQLVELGYSESSSQNQDLASSQAIQMKWLNESYPKSMEKLNVDITIDNNTIMFTFYNKNDSRPQGS